MVIKFAISWHCDISCQDTSCYILSDINSYFCVHTIIVDLCICSGYFTYCVFMSTFFCVRNRIKLDISISIILLSLNHTAIFKQFKGEGIGFKGFSFQFLSEIELCACRCWSEGIIELCICWKGFGCSKGMTIFRYSNRHLCLHWIISHSCF